MFRSLLIIRLCPYLKYNSFELHSKIKLPMFRLPLKKVQERLATLSSCILCINCKSWTVCIKRFNYAILNWILCLVYIKIEVIATWTSFSKGFTWHCGPYFVFIKIILCSTYWYDLKIWKVLRVTMSVPGIKIYKPNKHGDYHIYKALYRFLIENIGRIAEIFLLETWEIRCGAN